MSEPEFHKKEVVVMILFLGAVSVSCILWCGHLGRVQGRTEMKLWQDSYYAAHPVLKETTSFQELYTGRPAPRIEYVCPQGWEVSGGWDMGTGEFMEGMGPVCITMKERDTWFKGGEFPDIKRPIPPVKPAKASKRLNDHLISAGCPPCKIPIEGDQLTQPQYHHPCGLTTEACDILPAEPLLKFEDSYSGTDLRQSTDKPAEPAKPCVTPTNRPQDVGVPAYLEVNDCSWHHGRNPREAPQP